MQDLLARYLEMFDSIAQPAPGAYKRSHHYDGGSHDFHVVIGCMIHGNEVGSLPAVVDMMRLLRDHQFTFGGKVTFFVGNPEAGMEDARFLEADLNRVFVDDPPDNHEGRRARELKPLLDEADLFLDLHQTILATEEPFYIFPFSMEGWHWARAIEGARMWVTRHPGAAFSTGTCCADEYVRLKGKPGMTLELGEKGFHFDGQRVAIEAVRRVLHLADRVGYGADIGSIAQQSPELKFLHTVHREAFATEELALEPGWVNFKPVSKGQQMNARKTPDLVAPEDGFVLFPKYPPIESDGSYKKPLPGEIYRIVQELEGHPADVYGLR